jgi:hypothetical protein
MPKTVEISRLLKEQGKDGRQESGVRRKEAGEQGSRGAGGGEETGVRSQKGGRQKTGVRRQKGGKTEDRSQKTEFWILGCLQRIVKQIGEK